MALYSVRYTCNKKTFTITNSGSISLTVSNIITPHPYSANWISGTIPAGQSQNITISFCPIAPGTYDGTIEVVSDKTSGTNTTAVTGTAIHN